MRRNACIVAALFLCATAALWGLLHAAAMGLHGHWLAQMEALAGRDLLAARGYARGMSPWMDPTFTRVAFFLGTLSMLLPPAFGVLVAGGFLLCRQTTARRERRAAARIEAILRGDALDADRLTLLDERTRQLAAAMEQIRQEAGDERHRERTLVNDISHQLKTPIASLRLNLELLEDATLTAPERARFMAQAENQAQRIDRLVQSLVKVARLESGLIMLAPVPCDLLATLRGALAETQPLGKARGVALLLASAPEGLELPVTHDPVWTKEALCCVLDNAVKYAPEGGAVRVHVRLGISYARIDVEDDGSGLEPGELADLFRRFYRGRAARLTGQEGSGLGLHIAREIMRRQGGAITAEPLASGARFSLFLQKR